MSVGSAGHRSHTTGSEEVPRWRRSRSESTWVKIAANNWSAKQKGQERRVRPGFYQGSRGPSCSTEGKAQPPRCLAADPWPRWSHPESARTRALPIRSRATAGTHFNPDRFTALNAQRRGLTMASVARVTEISAISDKSFEDAIRPGSRARQPDASQSAVGMGQRAVEIAGDKITGYKTSTCR